MTAPKRSWSQETTFTSAAFVTRAVACRVPQCHNQIHQWLSRWGWLNVCAECAAERWMRGK